MNVRAKFYCNNVIQRKYIGGAQAEIELTAVTGGSEENKSFWTYTPSGTLKMQCVNEEATKYFEPGKEYYIDFTVVEKKEEVK